MNRITRYRADILKRKSSHRCQRYHSAAMIRSEAIKGTQSVRTAALWAKSRIELAFQFKHSCSIRLLVGFRQV